eukprot:5629431-Lingulodinium_polyedra.AAC.1
MAGAGPGGSAWVRAPFYRVAWRRRWRGALRKWLDETAEAKRWLADEGVEQRLGDAASSINSAGRVL